ncbi:unnamed protein product, partial [Brenthis ino]
MRRHRQKLSEEQLEQRRKKDRERYNRKKEQGLISNINELIPRAKKIIIQQWKERPKKYRDKKKAMEQIRQQTEDFVENDTLPDSPTSSSSRSRAESDDDNVATIEHLLSRSLTQTFKGTFTIHQVAWNKNSPGLLNARKLSCTECHPHQICPHYEIGIINTEAIRDSFDEGEVLPSSSHSDHTLDTSDKKT